MQQYARAARELLDNVANNVASNVAKINLGRGDGSSPLTLPSGLLRPLTQPQQAPAQPQLQPQPQHQSQQQQPEYGGTPGASGSGRPSLPVEARISRFKQELLASRINLVALRRLAYQGVPDKDGLRAVTWKVRAAAGYSCAMSASELMRSGRADWRHAPPRRCFCFCCLCPPVQLLLGYLPPDASEWDAVLSEKRAQYAQFCEVRLRCRTCTGYRTDPPPQLHSAQPTTTPCPP